MIFNLLIDASAELNWKWKQGMFIKIYHNQILRTDVVWKFISCLVERIIKEEENKIHFLRKFIIPINN